MVKANEMPAFTGTHCVLAHVDMHVHVLLGIDLTGIECIELNC